MRYLRELCAAVVLTIALAFTALAGDIDLPGTAMPATASSTVAAPDTTSPGESMKPGSEAPLAGTLTEAALGLWQTIRSLF